MPTKYQSITDKQIRKKGSDLTALFLSSEVNFLQGFLITYITPDTWTIKVSPLMADAELGFLDS